jgi:uncharacterized protein YjeT (DUF2065 family)
MRYLLYALSVLQLLNGLLMLSAPQFWYGAVPGVTETGPFNSHFVRDIGLGFLSAGSALSLAAWYPVIARPLVAVASVFLLGHALLHLVEMVVHGSEAGHAARDITLIVLPALLPLVVFMRRTSDA